VSIHPKTWEDIKTLNQIGRFQIFAEEKEGLFTVNFHDPLQYATITDFRGSIEEAVARILKNAQNCGYYDHIIGNKY
jgi:putative heme iron utilization protein